MSEPLYKIAGDLMRLIEQASTFDEDGNLILPEPGAMPLLDEAYTNFDAKVEACAAAMRSYEAHAEAANIEAARLADRAAAFIKRRDWIKAYLKANMTSPGCEKVEGELFTVSMRNTPPKVNVVDEALVPMEYFKSEVKVTLLKADILKAAKAGVEVPGVTITTDKTVVVK